MAAEVATAEGNVKPASARELCQTGSGFTMGRAIWRFYKEGCPRRTSADFNRWLKANAIVGAVFWTGLIALALAGSSSVRDAEVASSMKASDVAVSVMGRPCRRLYRPVAVTRDSFSAGWRFSERCDENRVTKTL